MTNLEKVGFEKFLGFSPDHVLLVHKNGSVNQIRAGHRNIYQPSMLTLRTHNMSLFVVSFGLLNLLLILSLCFHSSAISVSNETDRLALLEFKSKITHDPFGAMTSWNSSIHFCHWNGVTCGHRHQRVTILDLGSNGLAGSISLHIGNLSFLKNLILENNSFTGQIPPELGRLHRLQFLVLSNNSLIEGIPANLSACLNLIGIDLRRNHLSGSIPVEIGFLMNLKILYLDNNNLIGNLPSSLGNLSSLQRFAVLSNRLGGKIPDTLGQLKNLKEFEVMDNGFEGTIPFSIFNLSFMEAFSVGMNRLNGNLPLELGILFSNLQYLSIFENLFTGIIPSSISNASNLQQILLGANKLTGQVPALDNLPKLELLDLYGNSLGSGREGDMRFLSSLTNATSLMYLYIDDNNLGGVLPHSLANLSSTVLTHLQMGDNEIGGRLPAGIANLKSLQVLSLYSNRLSGSIPEDIGMLQSLQILDLDDNEFTGHIPASIGNLSNLASLLLFANKLQGSIPSSLGNFQFLLQFSIADNNISGSIPSTLFTISSLSLFFDLSRNKLTGSLPMEIGNLKILGQIDVSRNMLTGVIPSSFGSCTSLEYLYMEHNFFHGTIPSSFASLRGLRYLNLSHNNLSGEIPDFLGSIALENLCLSFNNFSGSAPSGGIFKNASEVSVEGNMMLCGATPSLHLPICISGQRKKMRMTMKLKIIIGIVLSFVAAFLLFLSFMFWLSRKKSKRAVPSSPENLLLQVSYQTLFRATEGFSSTNLIGMGSFGSVYKGVLDPQGTIVVKVFHLQRRGASRSFMVECKALRNIRHRNLLKVITACSSIDSRGDDFKAIVYEFMVNGNLDQWLHPVSDDRLEPTRKLNLLQRLNIAIDIACALDYLHRQYGQAPIVHCDLKPSNILLNDEMTAQVGDFGLMKFLTESIGNLPTSQTSTTGLRGTIGYAAPEYGTGSEVSIYGDMYSYGILLLEMFTAKRPTDDMFNNDLNLRNYVKMALPDQVARIVDPILVQEAHENVGGSERYQKVMESLVLVLGIGIACSEESPRERMDISDTLAELILVRNKQVDIIPRRRARAA